MSEDEKLNLIIEALRANQPEDRMNIDVSTVRYALYARKSTLDEDKQVRSIKDQITECTEKVILPNDIKIIRIYQESASAKESGARVEFGRLVDDIKAGRIDGLIAWHPDRLSRNMKDAGEIIDMLDRGLLRDLKFATFHFENNTAGKMLLGITFVVSKQYSEHLSESVNRGNKNYIEDGEFLGKFKHGYIIDAERHFHPDPVHFVKVRRMFEMSLEGKSQKEIREWINTQDYKVQKRRGSDPVSHVWSKDDVSELLRDPHYVGIHHWGKNNVPFSYDFTPMLTVDEFLKINKISTLNSPKLLAIKRPKKNDVRANLLRGMVYCGHCNKTLTSMLINDDKSVVNGQQIILTARYYYKCETLDCPMYGRAARAKYITDASQKFFENYLFITLANYNDYVKKAKENIKKKNLALDSQIASLNAQVLHKEKHYEDVKAMLVHNESLRQHYDLDKLKLDIIELKRQYQDLVKARKRTKEAILTYEKYLKLFESIPVILGKIKDMKVMDALLRIFFLNFTITANGKDFRQGSKVTYNLKEPWDGLLKDGKFVSGAA